VATVIFLACSLCVREDTNALLVTLSMFSYLSSLDQALAKRANSIVYIGAWLIERILVVPFSLSLSLPMPLPFLPSSLISVLSLPSNTHLLSLLVLLFLSIPRDCNRHLYR